MMSSRSDKLVLKPYFGMFNLQLRGGVVINVIIMMSAKSDTMVSDTTVNTGVA